MSEDTLRATDENNRILEGNNVIDITNTCMAIGKVVRSLRKQRHLTQEQLALTAGLDRTYISLLELGRRRPRLDTLLAISMALNCNLSEIVIELETNL